MTIPPIELIAASHAGARRQAALFEHPDQHQSEKLEELHLMGLRRREWIGELRGLVSRALAAGLSRRTIADALGLDRTALRRYTHAASQSSRSAS